MAALGEGTDEAAARIVYKLAVGEDVSRDYVNKAAKRIRVSPLTLLAKVREIARKYGISTEPVLLKRGAKQRPRIAESLEGKMRLAMPRARVGDKRIKTGRYARELPGLLQRGEHRAAVKREHKPAGLRLFDAMYRKDWLGGSRRVLDVTLPKYRKRFRGK